MSEIRLGALSLVEVIGSGAMGSVWRGRFLQGPGQGRDVAIKVLSADRAQHTAFRAMFRREISGVAALEHRHIISIYDFGEVEVADEEASGGKLLAGCPWLAMELVEGRTLSRPGLPWPHLVEALLTLLDALGHAHARNVVHRDVKPGNILLGRDGLKLGDFGLVYNIDDKKQTEGVTRCMGTPSYMAPEQFEGRWRDFGPWTDLYAVGCLAYALSSGHPPFGSGKTLEESMMGHLHQEPPPLLPIRAIPEEFPKWVSTLLNKDPARRFRRAAEAARALLALGGVTEEGVEKAPPSPELDGPTFLVTADLPTIIAPLAPQDDAGAPAPTGRGVAARSKVHIPVPFNWRRSNEDERPRWIQGIGLELFGLRTIPFVGREQERQSLWEALRRVSRPTEGARMILVRGEAGVGKTRLAEWLCERAHELGVASTLRAIHGPQPGPLGGMIAMVSRHLRCAGLTRAEAQERVEALFSPEEDFSLEEAEAITELIAPASQEDRDSGIRLVQFGRPEEWYLVLERLLGRLSVRRPVILFLDDVQWGLDALGFTMHLLKSQAEDPKPILVVMTVQEEQIEDGSIEDAWLSELEKHPRTTTLELSPLPKGDHARLTRDCIGLGPVLAAQVDRQARGVPLYAIQLVSQWAEEGRLESGDRGFRLRKETDLRLPDNLASIWATRVERFLARRPAGDGIVLELASALGEHGVSSELELVCKAQGVRAAPDLVDELVNQRLARRIGDGDGWVFASGMLHEVFESRAREAGRWTVHHRACAEVLQPLGGFRIDLRLGRHLLFAGEHGRAVDPLLAAAQSLLTSGEYISAFRVLERVREAAEAGSLPRNDSRWGRFLFQQAGVARGMGDYERGQELIEAVESAAEEFGWRDLLGAAKLSRANFHQDRFRVPQARPLYAEAQAIFAEVGNCHFEVNCWNNLGLSYAYSGESGEALGCFQRALSLAETSGNLRGQSLAHEGIASIALNAGDAETVRKHGRSSLALATGVGARNVEARAMLLLGDAERLSGDPERAEEHYRKAVKICRSIGAALANIAETHVAWALVEQQRYRDARPMLEEQIAIFEREGRPHFVAAAEACLMVCAAVDENWNTWWKHLRRAEALLKKTGFVDFTCPRSITKAGDMARAAGRRAEARRAYKLALGLWKNLGWSTEIEEVEQRVADLD